MTQVTFSDSSLFLGRFFHTLLPLHACLLLTHAHFPSFVNPFFLLASHTTPPSQKQPLTAWPCTQLYLAYPSCRATPRVPSFGYPKLSPYPSPSPALNSGLSSLASPASLCCPRLMCLTSRYPAPARRVSSPRSRGVPYSRVSRETCEERVVSLRSPQGRVEARRSRTPALRLKPECALPHPNRT